MPKSLPKSLDGLREDIDRLDDAILDLLVRRGDLVRQINKLKRGKLQSFSPHREARLLRRLVERQGSAGGLEASVITGVWREILANSHMLLGGLEIVIPGYGRPFASASEAVARVLGDGPVPRRVPNAEAVLREVARGPVDTESGSILGVLSAPTANDTYPWWPLLLDSAYREVQIMMHLTARDGSQWVTVGTGYWPLARSEKLASPVDSYVAVPTDTLKLPPADSKGDGKREWDLVGRWCTEAGEVWRLVLVHERERSAALETAGVLLGVVPLRPSPSASQPPRRIADR